MQRAKLAMMSVEELKKEITRRRKALPKLIASRDTLNCQIAELEALGAVKAVTAVRRRKAGRRIKRAARPGSLPSALAEALSSKGKLSVAEAAATVRAAGYKSKSKDFQNIVGMTLSQGKQFKRVGRGIYTLKG